MAETIHLRGEGGHIFTMDLPLPEGIGERYERGLLVRVDSDGTPTQPGPAPEAPAPVPVTEPVAGGQNRPALNAPKAEWVACVVARGLLSAEDAENYTKADLIDMVS
ncbi:hypothetical protein [Streptomyces sp. ADI98-10]|uniref:hypothetical protein n=1 Tax=Streptomyces sp. ADI98-10 TaxID=1522763 RepID=UPI000F556178|nr:hypothetical protein [Streptomyces sp. ADI98-10]RPK85067.1 hypothetical protein EES46_23275 [Streptomyces sp. ADI98-10]